MMEMTEIKHFDTHEVIQMIMEGVVKGNIESSQAIGAVKHLIDIDSKQAENFVAKPTENPLMQEFLDNANAYSEEMNCKLIELRGFSVRTNDDTSASRTVISEIARLYRKLTPEMRFLGFDRAGSALLVNKEIP
jgi:hypothetical protein